MKKIFEKIFKGYAVLEEVKSPINGKIEVREDLFDKRRLVVGGLSQSGEPVEKIWKKALKPITNHQSLIANCLILGLGAGSAAKLVSRFDPGVKIVGIEIDPEIIRLGKKYFGLGEIKNLEIKIKDATKIISHQSSIINHYDLILVDLYLGGRVPKEAGADKFLLGIRRHLAPDGTAIFNRLFYGDKRLETDKFEQKLAKIFPKIETRKTAANKLFLCQNVVKLKSNAEDI